MNRTSERGPVPGGWHWVLWLGGLGVLTATLVPVRSRLNEAHIALAFLLLVQFASARGGRALGFTVAVAAFFCFDFFLLPPYYTLHLDNPVDWLVLAAFLVTALVSAQLLYRAQAEAENARQRAHEVDRLASLGAETLSAGRADAALASIAGIIRATLQFDACIVYTVDAAVGQPAVAAQAGIPGSPPPHETAREARSLATWVAEHGQAAAQRLDRTSTLGVAPRDGRPGSRTWRRFACSFAHYGSATAWSACWPFSAKVVWRSRPSNCACSTRSTTTPRWRWSGCAWWPRPSAPRS